MNRVLLVVITISIVVQPVSSQSVSGPAVAKSASTSQSAVNPYLQFAEETVAAHGGDKMINMKSFVVRGSVEIGASPSQIIPATFYIAISGDRYVFELNNPLQPLRQVFDGENMHSSGYELPPVTSLGFPLLVRIKDSGYVVSAVADTRKKAKKGFRITTPDGFYTDFVVDEKTKQVKGYESSYDVRGQIVTTSVEIDEFQTVEGVLVPKKYSQRFDLGKFTAYAKFKTTEILINSPISNDVFALPK
jgi:hypothetical protein